MLSFHTKQYYSLLLCIFFVFSAPIYSAQQVWDGSLINSNAIIQDSNGFIWLSTSDGLIRHDSENSIIFNSNNKNWPIPFNWINDVHLIAQNKLLLATETHGLWIFDTLQGTASKLDVNIHRKSVYQIIEHQDYYYLDVPNKLYQVNSQTLSTRVIAENIGIKALKSTDDFLYVSTTEGVYKLVNNTLELIETGEAAAIETSKNTLLVAKDQSMITLEQDGTRKVFPIASPILTLAHSYDEKSIFAINRLGHIEQYDRDTMTSLAHSYSNKVPAFANKLFHDSTGVLWALTNQGVKQIVPTLNKNNTKVFDTFINSLSLTSHKNKIIIGSYGAGLHALQNNILPKGINESLSPKGKIITDLYQHNSSIYISTFDGLWQLNFNNGSLSRIDFPQNNMILLDISYKNNKLYLASNDDGVYIYDLKQKTISNHIRGEDLSSKEVTNTLPLDNNILWVATSAGVDIFNINNNTIHKIENLGENKVISLLEYNKKIFVATKGDGFFVYNLQGVLLAHFAKNIIFGYMTLIADEIWVSGRPGLYRINPNTYQLKMVPNTEQYVFTKKPIFMDNIVHAAHYGGVLEIPHGASNSFSPKIYISKTIASGKAQLLSNAIKIDSPNDVVTLELASLDFRPGQEKLFKYQINNGDWNDINGNQLTLTGLSSGQYHIEIMGTNSLGQWSNFKAYADIAVAYPWYWHPNSRIIYAVLIISAMFFTFWLLYLRSRSIVHIHKLLNEEIKTHGQSTSIIRRKLNKAKVLIDQEPSNQQAAEHIISSPNINHGDEVLALINECLIELKIQHGHVEPSNLSGSSLAVALPYLADYFHQQYHVLVSMQLDIACEKIDYTIQTAIYRIIYEAILTAISNGNSGVFAVHVNESNEKIWLKIKDNEQSFAQFNSKINFDMAMYYIRQVTNKFNATFHTYDNQEHGSEIIISIPLMKIS